MLVEYGFFRFNAAGLIDGAERAKLADDEAAAAHGRTIARGDRVEIWAGQRRVKVLPPGRPSGAGAA